MIIIQGSAEDAEDKVTELNRAVEELQKLLQVSADGKIFYVVQM